MAEGLSLREFGRQIDVSNEAVRKAIKTGKIPADCIAYDHKGWPRIIDPKRAAEHWGKNRDPNQVRDKAVMRAGAKRGWKQRRGEEPVDDEPAPNSQATGAQGNGKLTAGQSLPSITESKAITEAYKARLAKLEYEERSGRLVDAEKVKAGYVAMITTAKTRLLGVPSKAKGRIPHLTVADVEVLEDLIAEALEELALGR